MFLETWSGFLVSIQFRFVLSVFFNLFLVVCFDICFFFIDVAFVFFSFLQEQTHTDLKRGLRGNKTKVDSTLQKEKPTAAEKENKFKHHGNHGSIQLNA